MVAGPIAAMAVLGNGGTHLVIRPSFSHISYSQRLSSLSTAPLLEKRFQGSPSLRYALFGSVLMAHKLTGGCDWRRGPQMALFQIALDEGLPAGLKRCEI